VTPIGRAFLAVVPPDEVLAALETRVDRVRELEPRLKWVRREQLHVTLQFLGRVSDEEALVAALIDGVSSVPSFALQLGGAGAFPKPRRAAIVWAGVRAGEAEIVALAEGLQEAAATAGFTPEDRRFHPHVTLARVPRPRPVDALLAALGDDPIGAPFEVGEVVLFESDTRPDGAVYAERARLRLG